MIKAFMHHLLKCPLSERLVLPLGFVFAIACYRREVQKMSSYTFKHEAIKCTHNSYKLMYRTLAKNRPWAVHLTLGLDRGVGRHSQYHCHT